MRQHHLEVTYVLGRFMTEHFIRVYKAFEGDLTAAIVLGTIGSTTIGAITPRLAGKPPRFPSTGGTRRAPAARAALQCDVDQPVDRIPRETVRRKIRQLVAKGWLRKAGPDKLIVTSLPDSFRGVRPQTLEHFYAAAQEILQLVEKRSRS